jgi:sulfate transport system substrate-binding protein
MRPITLFFRLFFFSAFLLNIAASAGEFTLLNASYDPTRELYQELNPAFTKYWQQKTGDKVVVQQSHGGSGKQSRAVMDGLRADVVTLALAYDIDILAERGRLLPKDWQSRLPDKSAPYASTVVFLVRKGNPKGIKDWPDLAKPGIAVITPNPKTSGGARWNYLAAWAWAAKHFGGDEAKTKEFMKQLYRNVPVLDTGARGATTTFTQRGIGDAMICWENEAFLAKREAAQGSFEIVAPSVSILAEPSVAWVDKVVDRKGTRKEAKGYLEFLYTPEAQEIIAKHFYRPRSKEALEKSGTPFPKMELIVIDSFFGGWGKAHKQHFSEGGTFDQIFKR